jgi:hypothetical protein
MKAPIGEHILLATQCREGTRLAKHLGNAWGLGNDLAEQLAMVAGTISALFDNREHLEKLAIDGVMSKAQLSALIGAEVAKRLPLHLLDFSDNGPLVSLAAALTANSAVLRTRLEAEHKAQRAENDAALSAAAQSFLQQHSGVNPNA